MVSPRWTWPALWIAVALAVAIGGPVLAFGAARTQSQTTPEATVRDFLSAAVVDGDGSTACDYLTARARESFERHLAGPTCTTYFGSARLALGGPSVNADRGLRTLTYSTVADGAKRIVRVSRDGRSVRFVLRRANAPETEEFHAPPTPWRIDSDVTGAFSSP